MYSVLDLEVRTNDYQFIHGEKEVVTNFFFSAEIQENPIQFIQVLVGVMKDQKIITQEQIDELSDNLTKQSLMIEYTVKKIK